MTPPEEFKNAREALGLSQSQIATLLQVQSDRTVRRWEAGERDVPGPVFVLVRTWLESPRALQIARRLAE